MQSLIGLRHRANKKALYVYVWEKYLENPEGYGEGLNFLCWAGV